MEREDTTANPVPQWLAWVRELQALAQTGLAYAKDPYDLARYERLRRLSAEMMARGSDRSIEVVQGLFEGELGYPTPKVDVRAAVFRDDDVLLVRERSDGLWTLPGGWADPGETPSEAVEREVFEEAGYRVRAVRLLALYDRDHHGHPPMAWAVYKVYFDCEIIGGTPAESNETDSVDFFPVGALPDLSLTRVTPEVIHRLFDLKARRASPSDFD